MVVRVRVSKLACARSAGRMCDVSPAPGSMSSTVTTAMSEGGAAQQRAEDLCGATSCRSVQLDFGSVGTTSCRNTVTEPAAMSQRR
jgi:hypothetical protein